MSRGFQGYVEVVGTDRITGWCSSLNHPQQPVELELLVHGEVVARLRTALDRPDVAREIGGQRLCGFAFPLGSGIARFGPGEVLVRPVGGAALEFLDPDYSRSRPPASLAVAPELGQLVLPPPPHFPPLHEIDRDLAAAMLAQPFPFDLPATPPQPGAALEGALLAVEHGVLHGWALRRQAAPLLVELRVDGVAAGQRCADRAAPGFPHRGFALPLPDRAFDNQPHEIRVVEALTGEALPCPPLTVTLRAGAGSVRLRRGVLEGRVDYGNRSLVRLEVLVDGEPHFAMPITVLHRQTNPTGGFGIALPATLHDGAPHALMLRDAGSDGLLDAGPDGPSLTHQADLGGRLEMFSGGVLQGWAQDQRDPGAPVRVMLYDADRLVAETLTTDAQPDTAGRPGFRLPVPRALFDGAVHRLRVSLGALDLCLGGRREIIGVLAAADIDGTEQRFRGRLELASPELISGWAMDVLAADRPVQIAIELDGVTIGSVLANRYQPRFRSLSQHGQHGFEWPVPLECWNGRPRRLLVRIIGAAEPLAGSPVTLGFPSRVLSPLPAQRSSPLPAQRSSPLEAQRSPPLEARLSPLPAQMPPALCPADAPAPGLVSAIVLNRNGAALLEALFASIAQHVRTSLEVVLVDHASSDDSLAVAARWQGKLDIRVEARTANHSFSASNNLGARLARGQHVLFLNNDIELTHDPLPAMLRALAAPGVAAVGVRLAEPVVQPDGTPRPVLHHDGIGFRLLHGGEYGRSIWLPYEVDSEAADPSQGPGMVPAATAAMLMMRREGFTRLGGFDEGFDYGLEDVDLCLRIGRHLGTLVVARDTVAIHQRSATRKLRFAAALADPVQAAAAPRELVNRHHFLRRQAAWLKRRLRQAALNNEAGWREQRFRFGFALGDTAEDSEIAHALAAAMAESTGWDAALLRWDEHDLRGLDALLALHPSTVPRRMVNATPGLLTIAWVRDRVEGWLAAGRLADYDLVFAASAKLATALSTATGLTVGLLPLAMDANHFIPLPTSPAPDTDLLFPGDGKAGWQHLPALLRAVPGIHTTILGEGWPTEAPWRGSLAWRDRPTAYASARLVLDLAEPGGWEVLSSRVFEAAAVGTLVLADSPGAATLLPGLLPSFANDAELPALALHFLADVAARAKAAARLRTEVLAGHTYHHRAATLAAAIHQAAARLRFGIKLSGEVTAEAQALVQALRRQGQAARLDPAGTWQDGIGAGDDVSLVLGDAPGFLPDLRGLNLRWPFGAPTPDGFDHVFDKLPCPAPDDLAGFDAIAEMLISITQRLLDRA